MQTDNFETAANLAKRIDTALARSVVGQEQLRRRLLTSLLAGGHVLLEGVPGLAKTLAIKSLAGAVNGEFKRIQFTPDLLPADLVGTEIYRQHEGKFEVRRGPVFANFVLADEINRAPAKVQSALLETMQERQVTIGEQTLSLPEPFLVLATQNPLEQEGTYPLPEAQVDRFLLKVQVTYPTTTEERMLLARFAEGTVPGEQKLSPVAELADVRLLQEACSKIYVDEKVRGYMVDLVRASRVPKDFSLKLSELIELGASPRASISLLFAARAEALLCGEQYVLPEHVKTIAPDVLRHRIIPSYEAEARGMKVEQLIHEILGGIPVP